MKREKLVTICIIFVFSVSFLGFPNLIPTTHAVFGSEDILFEYGAESGQVSPPWSPFLEDCIGYAQTSTSQHRTGTRSLQLVITDHIDDRSISGVKYNLDAYNDPSTYPDLYFSWWVYIPTQTFFTSYNGYMNLARAPWEWFKVSDGWNYNFRTGQGIHYRTGGTNRWTAGGASLEHVQTHNMDVIYSWDGTGLSWNFDTWFHVQTHVYRTEGNDGLVETWINNQDVTAYIQGGLNGTGRTAYNSWYDPSYSYTEFVWILTNYVTSVPESMWDTPVTTYLDDMVVATEKVDEGYGVGYVSTEFESWETGFENAILDDFNGTSETNGTVTRSSTIQYEDAYSGNFTSDGTSGSGAIAYHVVQGTDFFYQRSHVYFDDLPVNGNEISFLGSNNGSGDYVNYARVMQNGSGTYWILRVAQTPTDNDKVYYKDNILNNTWYQVEVYMKMGASGNSTLWVNGSQLLSVTGDYSIHGELGNAYPEIWNDGTQGASVSIFHDAYRVDDVYIGSGTPRVFQTLEFYAGEAGDLPIENVMINGTYPTDGNGQYEWASLTYNTVYTFVVEATGYYPAWCTNVEGSYFWNGTHYLLSHNVTEGQTGYLQIFFFSSSQTYIQSSNTTMSTVTINEAFFEASHEDYLFFTVEGDAGETSSINVYIPTQGEPNAVYGASSYSWASLVLSVNVTHSSSATIQVVWTDATTWGGFNLFFMDGHSLSFQSEYTLTIEVTSGVLNATSGTLEMSEEQGTLHFTATNDSILSVTSPDAEGGFQISISGATETDHVGGFTYNTTISTGDTVTIWWGWRLESWADMYTLLGIGLGGVALMVASPTWVALELRKKIDADSLERLGYGVLLFIIGWGCVIIWLWS